MKAAVIYASGGPEVLQYEDVPDPELQPGHVIVDVRAIGIQGGDLLNRAGLDVVNAPHIVGYQASGIISEVASDVSQFQVGQRVAAFASIGSHAERLLASVNTVWAIPDNLSFESAAAVPVEFGTADDSLFEFGHLLKGETVLIQAAASGVGMATVQLAKAAGATVIGTASSDERLERLREYGLDHAINYVTSDLVEAVMTITDGVGVDLAVDSIGGATLRKSMEAIRYRGRISWVGGAGRDTDPPALDQILIKNASLNGVFLGGEMRGNKARAYPMIERLIERVAAGELTAIVDSTFPLADAAGAHRHIEARQAFGRVLLIP
jgi:NADPH2:quinone reductase